MKKQTDGVQCVHVTQVTREQESAFVWQETTYMAVPEERRGEEGTEQAENSQAACAQRNHRSEGQVNTELSAFEKN